MIKTTECPCCSANVSAFAVACPTCGFPVVLHASMVGKFEQQGNDPLELVAMNPHTPAIMLDMLLANEESYVRVALARNPNASEGLLLRIADDRDSRVRAELASSPYLTVRCMEKLTNDSDSDVLNALLLNPSTPTYILQEVEMQLASCEALSDDNYDEDYSYGDDDYGYASSNVSTDDFGNQYYRYGDTYLPYHDGRIEYDGKSYDVMEGDEYGGETMYFDEDNGWLTELP